MSQTRGFANDKVTTNDNRSLERMHFILCLFTFIIRRQWCKSTLEIHSVVRLQFSPSIDDNELNTVFFSSLSFCMQIFSIRLIV